MRRASGDASRRLDGMGGLEAWSRAESASGRDGSCNMRPLSEKRARACESAKGERCRCRCAGRLHGAQRVFEFLAPDDPHFVAREKAMRGRGATSGSTVGLTDQTTPDVYGTRPRPHFRGRARVAPTAGTDVKRLSRSGPKAREQRAKRADGTGARIGEPAGEAAPLLVTNRITGHE